MTTGRSEEVSPKRPGHAESARTLLAASRRGMLSTLDRKTGYPHGSVVEILPAEDGNIVVFLSNLAEHTANFRQDPRVSVLLTEDMSGERVLALGRATFQGRIEPVDSRDRYREPYLERHPDAAGYIDFEDFSFYRVVVERVRYIGGFGRMGWVEAGPYHDAKSDPLVEAAPMVLEHMNEDHGHNLVDYARAFTEASSAEEATMIRLDQHGFDMRVQEPDGQREVRVGFESPRTTSEEVHAEMVRLARRAREIIGDQREGEEK